jgi:hypothetical protein
VSCDAGPGEQAGTPHHFKNTIFNTIQFDVLVIVSPWRLLRHAAKRRSVLKACKDDIVRSDVYPLC